MKKLIGILMLICFISCSGGKEIGYNVNGVKLGIREVRVVHIDMRFSEDEVNGIKRALFGWERGLNGLIEFRVEEGFDMGEDDLRGMGYGEWYILKKRLGDVKRSIDIGGKTLGYCDRVGGNVMTLIWERVSLEEIDGIVMHEVGHLMGMGHGVGLMGVYYGGWRCIDKGSMEWVGSRYGVRVEDLNYCWVR